MSCHRRAYQWTEGIRRALPRLRQPQAAVLALWSLGMIWAGSCALTAVVLYLSAVRGEQENSVRQRLREWTYAAKAKA
ncbi:MAG: hypothetical protein ACR2PL_00995 [Dehalococcoidia bacterium]